MSGTIFQQGSVNTAALSVPGLFIQIQQPANNALNGAATNILGVVGAAIWGPVGSPVIASNLTDCQAAYGQMQARKYDLGTQVAIAQQQGASNFRLVRATDGSDTAATSKIGSTDITFTALYTGSLGNSLAYAIANGSQPSTWKLTLSCPGLQPERFDNISGGISGNTVTAGTGATAVPTLTFSAPQLPGGRQAVGSASLTVIGTPTIGAGGTGHVANDFITFSNGVVLKAATVVSGAVTVWSPVSTTGCSGGSLTGAGTATPTNPVAMISSSGSGIGATATLAWGLGPVTMQDGGQGYTSATCTVSAVGGSGTIASAVSVWPNMAAAINGGQSAIRGPSRLVTAAAGSAIDAPTVSTGTFSGGTDGYATLTSTTLVGVDAVPRKGMYALRSSGCSVAMLADADDSTQWTSQAAYALSEGTYMVGVSPAGDTITNVGTTKATAGIDNYGFKLMFGDWIYWSDQVNGVQARLVSPQAFAAGKLAALGPQESSLNKQLSGVIGSQKSGVAGSGQAQTWSGADLQALAAAGVDVITNPSPGGTYWAVRIGHNSSSQANIHGDSYTRMTNYIAATLAGGMGIFVGRTITQAMMREVEATLLGLGMRMQSARPPQIGTIDGSPAFSVTCSAVNNSPATVALGYLTADTKWVYLGINEEFIINMMGGASVTIQQSTVGGQPAAIL